MNPAFGEIVKEITEVRGSLRSIALAAGIAHTTLYDMLGGRPPQRGTLCKFADNLRLEASVRQRLFRAAGYLDPNEVERQPVEVGS
jgi:predicted transcriptional regulator